MSGKLSLSEHLNQSMIVTWPKARPGQTHWSVDSESNRFILGDGWIARDWFPERIPCYGRGLQHLLELQQRMNALIDAIFGFRKPDES